MLQVQKTNTILILGDSTSMSIGVERVMHPFLTAARSCWPANTRIVNSSLPGMTSGDAVTFFFRHQAELANELRAVVIYLGNCDTTSNEVKKGKVGKLKRLRFRLQELTGTTPPKTSIRNRLLHFEWNNHFDPAIESPESAEDFEYNLSQVVQYCESESIPVILVRPKANLFFPSGIGKGNFIFYRYFGIKDKIADRILIPDNRFKKALQLHESGRFEEAAAVYNEILLQAPVSPMSQEYTLLVLNNYAVARAEAGEYTEALYLLNLLLKERDVRKEIVYYNMAFILQKAGDDNSFRENLHLSYESDTSLFRVRAPYQAAIDRIAERYKTVKLIDMHTLIGDEYFLDHCHPLLAGQQLLSDKITEALTGSGISGTQTASIKNILYSPELGTGNVSFFHDYFKTYAPFTQDEIKVQVSEMGRSFDPASVFDASVPAAGSLSKELRTAVEYYFRHPLFVRIKDVLHFSPEYPSDIGRFPEYFIIRHLIPYMRLYEADSHLSVLHSETGLRRTAEELLSILPEKAQAWVADKPMIDRVYETERVPLILEKIKELLVTHLSAGNQIYERTKSTIFWYVRETLRFGSHSRYSMRYDRMLLEFLAEGLVVAAVLDHTLGLDKTAEIKQLAGILEETTRVHEKYCRLFSLKGMPQGLLTEYEGELSRILSYLTKETGL